MFEEYDPANLDISVPDEADSQLTITRSSLNRLHEFALNNQLSTPQQIRQQLINNNHTEAGLAFLLRQAVQAFVHSAPSKPKSKSLLSKEQQSVIDVILEIWTTPYTLKVMVQQIKLAKIPARIMLLIAQIILVQRPNQFQLALEWANILIDAYFLQLSLDPQLRNTAALLLDTVSNYSTKYQGHTELAESLDELLPRADDILNQQPVPPSGIVTVYFKL